MPIGRTVHSWVAEPGQGEGVCSSLLRDRLLSFFATRRRDVESAVGHLAVEETPFPD